MPLASEFLTSKPSASSFLGEQSERKDSADEFLGETPKQPDVTSPDFISEFKEKYGKSPDEMGYVESIEPSLSAKLFDPVVGAQIVSEKFNNIYKAAAASRLNGLIDQAWGALVSPKINDTHAKELGFASAKDFNEHNEKIYKERLLQGVNTFEKVTGASLGTILSFGADAAITRGIGAISPVTQILNKLPASRWARLLKLTNDGMTLGTYGAGYEALRQVAEEGSVNDTESILFWGGASVLGGAALSKLLRVGSKAASEAALKTIEKRTQQAMKDGKSAQAAYDEALARSGFTSEEIASVVTDTGRSTHWQSAVSKVTPKQINNSMFGRIWDSSTSALSSIGRGLDKILTPISTTLRYKAPALLNHMRENVLWSNRYHQGLRGEAAKINVVAEALPKQLRIQFWDALNNSKRFMVDDIVDNMPKQIKYRGEVYNPREVVDNTRKLLDTLRTTENAYGIETRYLEDYWPHVLKRGHYEKLMHQFGREARNDFQQMISTATKNNGGKELSQGQLEDLMVTYLKGGAPKNFYQPLITKPRSIDFITKDIAHHYEHPSKALLTRIDRHAHAIAKRRFFGKHMVDPSIDATGEEAVPKFVLDLLNREEIYAKDMPVIKDVLTSFTGYKPSGRAVQGLKNVFYTTKIGQFGSALTQVGDIGVAAYVNGLVNTITGTFRAGGKRGVDPFKEFALQHVAEELSSTGKTAKMLDIALKGSLFKSIDKLGKTIQVNGAWTKNQRLVKSVNGTHKFRSKWAPFFGDETEALINDLKRGEMTDNVRLLLWNELSDVQPVSLLEVPQAYLNAPTGRMLYALKTFALKQLDILRRDAIHEIKQGNVGKGLANLARYTFFVTSTNSTVEQTKNFISGRDVDFTDVQFNNMLKQLMLSEYFLNQLSSGDKESDAIAQQVLAAPIGAGESAFNVVHDLTKAAEGLLTLQNSESLQDVPILGRIIYNIFGKGAVNYRRRQEREALTAAGFEEEDVLKYERDTYGAQ